MTQKITEKNSPKIKPVLKEFESSYVSHSKICYICSYRSKKHFFPELSVTSVHFLLKAPFPIHWTPVKVFLSVPNCSLNWIVLILDDPILLTVNLLWKVYWVASKSIILANRNPKNYFKDPSLNDVIFDSSMSSFCKLQCNFAKEPCTCLEHDVITDDPAPNTFADMKKIRLMLFIGPPSP